MAIVRPFKGLRPKPELASEVASPPYDVLNSREARELVKKFPKSFLRVSKPEVDFSDEIDQYSSEVYKRGRENLVKMIADGVMKRDQTDSFYLYRLTWKGQSQTGLVALTSVEDYNNGLIKKHEKTRPAKVNDRCDHIMTVQAQVGPVFSTFHTNRGIKNEFARLTASSPQVDFVAIDDVRHELWVISSKSDCDALVAAFEKLDALYIADGHHRSEAASEVYRRMTEKQGKLAENDPARFFLNVIFPGDELRILPYNRVVIDLGGLSLNQIIEKASERFIISESKTDVSPDKNGQFGLYCEGKWYLLVAKPGSFDADDPSAAIDSAILTSNLLDPILDIKDLRTDKRIDFVGGIRGNGELVKLVDSGEFKIAFSLPAVTVGQLLAVADAGQVMPPKSTWFEPKLRSGMVVNMLTDN